MFRGLKDKTLSFALKGAINFKIKEIGKMLKFDLDSQNKSFKMEVLLQGEKEPLEIQANRYQLIERDGRYYIVLEGIKTSREWMNQLLKKQLEYQEFEIPEKVAKSLKMVI